MRKIDYKSWTWLDIAGRATMLLADELYPFALPCYDEDAGVYTDYGQNRSRNMWLNIVINDIGRQWHDFCLNSGLEFDNEKQIVQYDPRQLPVGIHFVLSELADNDKFRQRIITALASEYWESDGHYSGQTKSAYIAEQLQAAPTARWFHQLIERTQR